MLTELADNIESVIKNEASTETFIYSTTEDTFIALAAALEWNIAEMPPLSSYFAIDLLKKDDEYYIRSHFNGVRELLGCDQDVCKAEDVLKHLRLFSLDQSLCMDGPHRDEKVDYLPVIVFTIASLAVVCCTVVAVIVAVVRKNIKKREVIYDVLEEQSQF